MANPKHLEILRRGVKAWDKWREKRPEVTPELGDANLFGADLTGADFTYAMPGSTSFGDNDLSQAKELDDDDRAARVAKLFRAAEVFGLGRDLW